MTQSKLADIAKEVAACHLCPLYKSATHPVPGVGSPTAEVMFIGEGPGEREDALGEPFVGAAGQFLDELLGIIGLKREEVYIANVIKHRSPGNRDPKPAEIEACWPYLKRQIAAINPKLIVLLGRHSLGKFLPGMAAISQLRGRAFIKDGQAYFVTYHPAAALYREFNRPLIIEDFKKIPTALKKISERK